jgi:2',3'-cyclic-nucleotide 2'-phosphodiesterase (5'-nucleotidase family)
MRTLVISRLLRSLMFLSIVWIGSSVLFAQSAAIEPCQATPTPKAGATTAVINSTKVKSKASETIIDSSIADDRAVETMLAPYGEKVRALSIVIGTLEGELKKGTVGAGTLGNFVTDAMFAEATKRSGKKVVLAIMNAGGLRKNEIAAGQLRASDIFELLPFENALMTIDVTGAQLAKLVQLGTRDAQAGARIQFRWNQQNRTEVISAKLIDANHSEIEIDPNALYTIVTIDYLYKLKSGSYSILQEGKNATPLNVTLRDGVMDYVKSETGAGRRIRAKLDDRFVQVGPGPAKPEDPPND